MEDFLADSVEKEICQSCKNDYLQSSTCEKCRINKFIEDLLNSWHQQKDFQKIATYNGINLGDLSRYDLQQLLTRFFLSKMDK